MGKCINMPPFKDFLIQQRDMRQLNNREFARLLDISESTLYRLINDKHPELPSREVLVKIAEATSTPLSTLVELTNPEVAEHARSSANAQFLAEMIEGLDEQKRKFVMTLVETLLRQGDDE
jgi:transcriptional regulator with XRE-family HTH domain